MSQAVLFLCCNYVHRSQMAAGFARHLLPPETPIWCATTKPVPPDPRAVLVMAEVGIDISDLHPKSLADIPVDTIGRVITLGNNAAKQYQFLPATHHEHWPLRDFAHSEASDELGVLRSDRDEILARTLAFSVAIDAEPAVGIIGGSGFYNLPGLAEAQRLEIDTPFGAPSSPLMVGRLAGRRVVFLARHGLDHTLLPSEVNARANVYALKRIGVTKVISVSAVGSLRESIVPGDVVLPRQFIDRTVGRPATFFGGGVVAHVSLADPVCSSLADRLADIAEVAGARVHRDGVYLCIEGPQFSTRAESKLWQSWGADVVGMTNLPEARLAREAELCYATLALPTDYDCWRTRSDEVRVTDVIAVLQANVDRVRKILTHVFEEVDPAALCRCNRVLDSALLTRTDQIDWRTRLRLHALLKRRLQPTTIASLSVSS